MLLPPFSFTCHWIFTVAILTIRFFLQKIFRYIKFSHIWFFILHTWLMLYTLKYLRFSRRKKQLVKSVTVKGWWQVNENGGKHETLTYLGPSYVRPYHAGYGTALRERWVMGRSRMQQLMIEKVQAWNALVGRRLESHWSDPIILDGGVVPALTNFPWW